MAEKVIYMPCADAESFARAVKPRFIPPVPDARGWLPKRQRRRKNAMTLPAKR